MLVICQLGDLDDGIQAGAATHAERGLTWQFEEQKIHVLHLGRWVAEG